MVHPNLVYPDTVLSLGKNRIWISHQFTPIWWGMLTRTTWRWDSQHMILGVWKPYHLNKTVSEMLLDTGNCSWKFMTLLTWLVMLKLSKLMMLGLLTGFAKVTLFNIVCFDWREFKPKGSDQLKFEYRVAPKDSKRYL